MHQSRDLSLLIGAATSVTAVAVATSFLLLSRTSPSRGNGTLSASSPNPAKPGKADASGSEDGKRYDTKKEFYNPLTGRWDARDEDEELDKSA